MRKQVATLAVLLALLPMTGSWAATCGSPAAADAPAQAEQGGRVVVLTVVIEPDGSISNATIEKSSGVPALDWAALDQARHMRLQPGQVDGTPVRSQKKIMLGLKPPSAPPKHSPPPSRDVEA